MKTNTTLSEIYSHNPDDESWFKLLSSLEKTTADNEPLTFSTILESTDILDAVWFLRSIEENDVEIRSFAREILDSLEYLIDDDIAKIKANSAREYINGGTTCSYAALAAVTATYGLVEGKQEEIFLKYFS